MLAYIFLALIVVCLAVLIKKMKQTMTILARIDNRQERIEAAQNSEF